MFGSHKEYQYSSLKSLPERYEFPLKAVLFLLLAVASCITTFFAGKHFAKVESKEVIQLDIIPQVLQYNRTFSEDPALRKGLPDIWDTIFPNSGHTGGYFAHPTLAPRRSTFSAYHQLHCLHAIREAYYEAIHAANEGRPAIPEEMDSHIAPRHIRHCIDLIRQSLMCNADTTIEVKDYETGGVRGFGTEHQCKDWFGLVRWTEETQKTYGMKNEPFENK